MADKVPAQVTCEWLNQNLSNPGIRVVDMRGYVVAKLVEPGLEEATYKGAYEEYLHGHIPGAVYADWTQDIIDKTDSVSVQIAPPEVFAQAMAERGGGIGQSCVPTLHTIASVNDVPCPPASQR